MSKKEEKLFQAGEKKKKKTGVGEGHGKLVKSKWSYIISKLIWGIARDSRMRDGYSRDL